MLLPVLVELLLLDSVGAFEARVKNHTTFLVLASRILAAKASKD